MTDKECVDIAKIQTDVRWIREAITKDGQRISSVERVVWIGMGILLAGEAILAYIK